MASAPDFSARRAALDPQARAFTDHTTARQWTFAEVDAEAERVAAVALDSTIQNIMKNTWAQLGKSAVQTNEDKSSEESESAR